MRTGYVAKMGLLTDIQASLLGEQPIGPVLLKLRFLAARLGSEALEEWVSYEAEGYPPDVVVPQYRKFSVSYTGSFNGPLGRTATNIPIPPYIIVEHAGKDWLNHDERQSVTAIESIITSSEKNGTNPQINAANLVILLSTNVFEGMACHSVRGIISRASMVEMVGSLRSRVLDLTLRIEKNVPGAAEIIVGQAGQPTEPGEAAVVTHIVNQIMNGPVGSNVSNSGANAQFNVNVRQGDLADLSKALADGGLSKTDADEFATLVASEKPEGPHQPFGNKAKAWIEANIGKALSGTWKIGAATATALLTDAVKHFYGLN